jgi:hypothetical protein
MKLLSATLRVHDRAEFRQRGSLAERSGKVERTIEPDRGRHGLRNQRLDRGHAERGEHGAGLGGARSDVPRREVGGLKGHGQPPQISAL